MKKSHCPCYFDEACRDRSFAFSVGLIEERQSDKAKKYG
jgi:hypothetical protein